MFDLQISKRAYNQAVGACLKKSVPGSARLHENVTKAHSRLRLVTLKRNRGRFSVTQKRNQGRFPVTLGYTKT